MMTCNKHIIIAAKPFRLFLTGALLIICQVIQSQTTITIGGDIYGGGKNGAVGTSKTSTPLKTTAKKDVELLEGAVSGQNVTNTTNITINSGTVRTVFGGGQDGRTFGNTSVTVNGGTVGGATWNNTIHGGVFGAGDGSDAYVFGNSQVTLNGGDIYQNIYGGGNQADLIGTTSVTLKGGNIFSTVYGGARVADIFGYSYVDINGFEATNNLIIRAVYGGNDIGGTISLPKTNDENDENYQNKWHWIDDLSLPSSIRTLAGSYGVNKTWNAFVHSSASTNPNRKIYVGQLFGGGNGDYSYDGTTGHWTLGPFTKKEWNTSTNTWNTPVDFSFSLSSKPVVSKVYLQLEGGNFGYVYGGGNQATVSDEAVICLNNTTQQRYQLEASQLRDMGINLDVDAQAYTLSGSGNSQTATPVYQFDRVFGGNKQADMDIHPQWHLEQAHINALYSGGDAGNMTYKDGLLLVLSSSGLNVNNVYGGCRRADVTPTDDNGNTATPDITTDPGTGISFPAGYSAHVLITGGTINNVYGGNDISGTVLGGNAVDIRHSITGNVYGGGNGSYVYTDKVSLANDAQYGDFYYGDYNNTQNAASIAKLNLTRPHAEKSYIHVSGKSDAITRIPAVFGGGNSATVTSDIKLVLGEYTVIDNVYLGSNGAEMISQATLQKYKEISNLDLTDSDIFAAYMDGATVSCMPSYDFDGSYPSAYNSQTDSRFAHIGSFFCGGNVGSMTSAQTANISFTKPIIITNKLVGGCNNAFVTASSLNAGYEGGLKTASSSGTKIHLSVKGVIFANPQNASAGDQGNIFGGCFNSGIVNGDVVIDLKQDIIPSSYFTQNNTFDDYVANNNNLFNTPFSVFGGGFGSNATIEGNTTINIETDEQTAGRALKVFGGGYGGTVTGSTTVNLKGGQVGKIYGGGFQGLVQGNTTVNLIGGTVYDSFGGSCNADINGYAQTYIGQTADGSTTGFTTVTNNVFGGNDFGGTIKTANDFSGRIRQAARESNMVYNSTVPVASAYVEYVQGSIANYLLGGSCGAYTYAQNQSMPYLTNAFVNFKANTNTNNRVNKIFGAGLGKTGTNESDNKQDMMQDRSYVLIDAPLNVDNFTSTDVFGAGAYSGIGMKTYVAPIRFDSDKSDVQNAAALTAADNVSAVVDLINGHFHDAYGASFNEGVTRRTVVNVPSGSTIYLNNLFGGGYGSDNTKPCDTYEAIVNWSSNNAIVGKYNSVGKYVEGIYGGNNNCRRTLYSFININASVYLNKQSDQVAAIYGGGLGPNTWTQYTEINLNDGARVYEVYGGGNNGQILNVGAVAKRDYYTTIGSDYDNLANDLTNALVRPTPLKDDNGNVIRTNTNVYIWKGASVCGYMIGTDRKGAYAYGGGLGADAVVNGTTYVGLHGGIVMKDMYAGGTYGGVSNMYKVADFTAQTYAFVEGGAVRNVYGGGWEGNIGYINPDTDEEIPGIANVVVGIRDEFKQNSYTDNGITKLYGFYKGVPTVERNAYAGGEGGAVIGTAKITVNNGFIGYRYLYHNTDNVTDNGTHLDRYKEKLNDETYTKSPSDSIGWLVDKGNVFGGGYDDKSNVDHSYVTIWGGMIRNSVYGGGEIATIGRGTTKQSSDASNSVRELDEITMPGSTNVTIYSGKILQNVFGGGKGYSTNDFGYSDVRRYTDGYVFGNTEVYVYGGEIGTEEGVENGYGNVFGGGNVGYVFGGNSKKWDTGAGATGYYYEWDNNDWVTVSGTNEKKLSENCKVVVSPHAKVLVESIVLGGHTYHKNEYVPTSVLNTIKRDDFSTLFNNNPQLAKLDESGVIIHNAVFAGGNVSTGNTMYANTKTVFGNVTASLNDIYNRDLITIGTEHVGGLYGDGNLTRVDGYREINVTNYGTDYYGFDKTITKAQYDNLSDRERAYFKLQYKPLKEYITYYTDTDGQQTEHQYHATSSMTIDELKDVFPPSYFDQNGKPNSADWEEEGVCSIYAGRLLNTIQRADFAGIFGSRMVMQGAQDRVTDMVDYTNYTVNRVGEISLNRRSTTAGDNNLSEDYVHGNYFGIYNIVNYLGALTSDIDFSHDSPENRTSESTGEDYWDWEKDAEGEFIIENGHRIKIEKTFYDWKKDHYTDRKRNNGNVKNKVALASGVYLELTTENSTAENKDWGLITGVVELDLINVMPYLGGGYVYAKNEHRTRSNSNTQHVILSEYNTGAISNKLYTYEGGAYQEFQTSGNFIKSDKYIIDDCYPEGNQYQGENAAPAHYWYIKGDVYVYDMVISAYTGAPSAYSKSIKIPLTITAGSHGTIKLKDVQPSKYAYYDATGTAPISNGATALINNKSYKLNDVISYWDWSQLSQTDQNKFVDETYVAIADFKLNGTTYHKGDVWLPDTYEEIGNPVVTLIDDANANDDDDDDDDNNGQTEDAIHFTDLVRPSNNMTHNNGYILTLDMNNPSAWDKYYSPETTSQGVTVRDVMNHTNTNYLKAPTYKSASDGVFGQKMYSVGNIITNEVKSIYDSNVTGVAGLPTQATFEQAYILTEAYEPEAWNKGYIIGATQAANPAISSGLALFCVQPWELSYEGLSDATIIYGTLMTRDQIHDLVDPYYPTVQGEETVDIDALINDHFSQAWYCKTEGMYGGNKFEANHNYFAKDAWSAVNPQDRYNFNFNYDAFDVLIDPLFEGEGYTYKYDGYSSEAASNKYIFNAEQSIDYMAKYYGEDAIYCTVNDNGTLNVLPNSNGATLTIQSGSEVPRAQFESLPNEQYRFAPIEPDETDNQFYVVKKSFVHNEKPYAIGSWITKSTYDALNQLHKDCVDIFTINYNANERYYYCRYEYSTSQQNITFVRNVSAQTGNATVNIGDVITSGTYNSLPNLQKNFTVSGRSPEESSTLYVAGESDILDLSKEKIITVVYEYNYDESDEEAKHINPISERHIINIRVEFKSGSPSIGDLAAPSIILPGDLVTISQPAVDDGAYRTINGGWELFSNINYATDHVNGIEFDNSTTKFYWYQNEYYIAYYARNYLGKTYSNPVKLRVANYHDINDVMADAEHHMYVDHPDVDRASKIYISNNNSSTDANKTELDLLYDLYDLSLHHQQTQLTDEHDQPVLDSQNEPVMIDDPAYTYTIGSVGHKQLNQRVKGLNNLEFILTSDVHPASTWTSIGNSQDNCFKGNLHGDGHTISGLSSSLFNYLCGNVYNLGVTGTFTGSGISEHGGTVENCWIMTTGTIGSGTKAIIGDQGVVKNSYYPNDAGSYQTAPTGAIGLPLKSFRNGEVTYNLNSYYLNKKYTDGHTPTGQDVKTYAYFTKNESNGTSTLVLNKTGKYKSSDAPYSDGLANEHSMYHDGGLGYVEYRYYNGDFVYADGSVPTVQNERHYINTESDEPDPYNNGYYPIWPDDYIYFGQILSYGYDENQIAPEYQPLPSIINKTDRLATGYSSNRVYRAPAYFGNKTVDQVYFNQYAVLPANSSTSESLDASLRNVPIYPGLTAIDFTEFNSTTDQWGNNILDMELLTGIRTDGQTKNLLVYAPESMTGTDDVLDLYFGEPDFAFGTYNRVAVATTTGVHGHLVNLSSEANAYASTNGYYSNSNHLLVDQNDFNAPIKYQFTGNYRMWYQRTPSTYVNSSTGGWETVSLPFTAEYVTTQTKGELTHFYVSETKGHEYWLRKFNSVSGDKATFATLPAATENYTKTVNNTYLYDYYYSKSNSHDANDDTYFNYYSQSRSYTNYPLAAAGKGYLIGFPGGRYYEFDLSNTFEPQNTKEHIAKIPVQVISFVSKLGQVVDITDDEYTAAQSTGYVYMPTYQAQNIPGAYVIDHDGVKFEPLANDAKTKPFHAYIKQFTPGAPSRDTRASALFISTPDDSDSMQDLVVERGLNIYGENMSIVIESTLEESVTVTITTVAGKQLKQVTVLPNTKVTVPVNNRGVYIVNRHKIAVTK